MPDLLDALREKLTMIADETDHDRFGFGPAARSKAAHEIEDQGAFAGEKPWGAEPVEAAFSMAALQLTSARDHVRMLARALTYPPSIFACRTIARGAVEASARAWHLLDPGIGPKERVARVMTERLYRLRERMKYPKTFDKGGSAGARINEIIAVGKGLGYEVTEPKGRAPYVEKPRPSATLLIESMMSTPGLGEAVFREFSAIAHAQAEGLLSNVIDGSAQTIDGAQVARAGLSPLAAITVVSGAFIALHHGFDRLASAYGWDHSEVSAQIHAALGHLHEMLHVVQEDRLNITWDNS
jgi:hypothetical protein